MKLYFKFGLLEFKDGGGKDWFVVCFINSVELVFVRISFILSRLDEHMGLFRYVVVSVVFVLTCMCW